MATVISSHLRQLRISKNLRHFSVSSGRWKTFEPDYLDSVGPQPPVYPPIDIQMKGFDYPVLENFHRFVYRFARRLGLDVSDSWATPGRNLEVHTFLEGGVEIKDSYELQLYERNVQIANLRSIDAPILVDAVRIATPPGVKLAFYEHRLEHREARYIPDPFLNNIRQELQELEDKKEAEIEKAAMKKATKEANKSILL